MTSRERILSALRLEKPDRVPRAMGWNPVVADRFESPPAFRRRFGIDAWQVAVEPTVTQTAFRDYLHALPAHVRVGDVPTLKTYAEWNYRPPGIDGVEEGNPLGGARSTVDLAAYVFPEVASDDRVRKLAAEVEALHAEGLAVVGRSYRLGGHMFEMAQRLRGFERLSYDFTDNPDLADYLFGAITDMGCQNGRLLARVGADVLSLNDDVGMPRSMLVSPGQWRKTVKPGLARIIAEARAVNADLCVLYHSDGWYEPIVPDLIEIGVNAIEPVQPDCMDPAGLKRRFGDRLAFWGTVGTPIRWAWARPEAIEGEVARRIRTVGAGSGLVLGSAYDIEPDTPWENVQAFFEAADRYGEYTT